MKSETTQTRLEDFLLRGLEKKSSLFNIVGTSASTAISYLLSQSLSKEINELPRLVVVASLDQAHALEQHLQFFSDRFRCHILQQYDVSPYSGLYPSPSVRFARTRFLYWAARAQKSDIFIAPIAALLQLTVPFAAMAKRQQIFKIGDELPDNLAEYFNSLGYQSTPLVEDIGQYSLRGGIVDVYSPAEPRPIRIELFGDQIETMRTFSLVDQRSLSEVSELNVTPAFEVEFNDENIESIIKNFRETLKDRKVLHAEVDEVVRGISLKNYFPGSEFLLSTVYPKLETVLDHFSSGLNIFLQDPSEISRAADEYFQELKTDERYESTHVYHPPLDQVIVPYENLKWPDDSRFFQFSRLAFLEDARADEERIEYNSLPLTEFSQLAQNLAPASDSWMAAAKPRLQKWLDTDYKIFVAAKNQTQIDRLRLLLQKLELTFQVVHADEYLWETWIEKKPDITIVPRFLLETILLADEKVIFLRTDDFFGRKQRANTQNAYVQFSANAKSLAFGDLKPSDLVVHVKHGIGVYEGLKIMNIGGVASEFIQVAYKDKDKLYLPVYRVGQLQKFSGAGQTSVLDKLGGTGWEKTKIKVKAHLRDIAADLLQLYAKRNEITRPPLSFNEIAYHEFEKGFPFDETDDQLKAINDIQRDFLQEKPMDRLICGDVGFGKTEVSMRAAFQAVQNKKQVAILAPTTVLTFQHLETFNRRFTGWNFQIRSLNRFVAPAQQKKTLAELKEGKVDILIGTHRLLSKDVVFKDLGLLIVDEEQKFGVTHKEKIKKFKTEVDTLTLSATPIPRTLNMSFTGMRDLSIINTAPIDRLPTRTFISKFDTDLIRKGIQSEIARGGQVYFIHNRVQSIYGLADELKQIVPDARMKVAHGQMNEEDLEHAMLSFFNHEIDVLICTAIVESGMDVPRANTMFIDQAHMFGLSQLYQLRGRVGRSKARAFCYLLLPKDKKIEKHAQERLKIIQDNSALGSGIRIAQYDLELRGAGNILGDNQSGHVNSVGYELYMDLLNEALAEAKGEPLTDRELDPEINLRVPALIPDAYIADIRIRLSYYKALADITSQEDLDRIEEELKDQFGEIPEPVINLMGLMLIRKQCKDLGVRDISAGAKSISLIFTERTKLKPETAIQLAMRENKKYSITPDQRLNIRLNNITWSAVYEELNYLLTLI
ncbi:MAG: transcription-repair coupling factor [Bdellovibrionaceae bacterium]|nr:transcription-repair coupling factor [Bdellovibrio sp.]